MKQLLIDKTNKYSFYRLQGDSGTESIVTTKDLQTFFVHEGTLSLSYLENNEHVSKKLKSNQGFTAVPGMKFTVTLSNDFVGVMCSSEIPEGKQIIEFIDDGNSITEVNLEGIKVITDPKIVSKPWGHELWVLWTKEFHVLKQIAMNAGNRSSLQYHEQKLETNYLVQGQADVIDGVPVDANLSVAEQVEWADGLNWQEHCETKHVGDYWTSVPRIVHRVIASEDYVAYEVSTPELDDVVRLHDDKGRHSGRIDSEHASTSQSDDKVA